MPPARPRSTKLMNNIISRGRLKNSKIHSSPGLIRLNNCNPFLRRKKFTMGFALFRENTGRSARKGYGHLGPWAGKLIILLSYILLTDSYLLSTGQTHAIMCIRADINHILYTTLELVS